MDVKFPSRILVWLLLALPISAAAARFSLQPASFDGGGGLARSQRFTITSTLSAQSSDGSVVVLDPPAVANRDFFVLPAETPFVLPTSALLGNDSLLDPFGATITLPGTNTAAGGSVILTGGSITYRPPPTPPTHGDSFIYILTDPAGMQSVGKVSLASSSVAPKFASLQHTSTNVTFRFLALPDRTYFLQSRARFVQSAPWLDFPSAIEPQTQRADANGLVQFTIPLGAGSQFFRAADLQTLRDEIETRRIGNQLAMTLRGAPNASYKLQSSSALGTATPWQDYPSSTQPFVITAAIDGFYQFSLPIAAGTAFFRSVPVFE